MFDPYLEWLKIPADHRPPTHYELLGIPSDEADTAVIHKAVMERMALVRRYQLGEHAADVLRLLNELSTAFNCLNDAERRQVYNEQLRANAETTKSLDRAFAGQTVERTITPLPAKHKSQAHVARSPRPGLWWALAALATIVVAGAVWIASLPEHSKQATDVRIATRQTSLDAQAVSTGSSEPAAGQEAADRPLPAEPRLGREPQLRWFGYATAGPGKVIGKVAPYTNVVFVRDWVDRGNDVILAAEDARMPMVLGLMGKEMTKGAGALEKVLSKRGYIAAVCWIRPYYFGFTPADVENAGRRIKQTYPGVQFWLGMNDKRQGASEDHPVPDAVDVLLLLETGDTSGESVLAKANEILPDWIEKAQGRPIVWCWSLISKQPKGIVPGTVPGTFQACGDVVRKHQLAGLIFERYGDPKGQDKIPIDRRPELVAEIRQLAGEFGFDTEAATPATQ